MVEDAKLTLSKQFIPSCQQATAHKTRNSLRFSFSILFISSCSMSSSLAGNRGTIFCVFLQTTEDRDLRQGLLLSLEPTLSHCWPSGEGRPAAALVGGVRRWGEDTWRSQRIGTKVRHAPVPLLPREVIIPSTKGLINSCCVSGSFSVLIYADVNQTVSMAAAT